MDGVTFLRKIMALRPMPVVMVSSLTQAGAETTLEALEIGAVDFIAKPTGDLTASMMAAASELQAKVKAAARARVGATARRGTDSRAEASATGRLRRKDHRHRRVDRRRGGAEGGALGHAGRQPAGPDYPAYAAALHGRVRANG